MTKVESLARNILLKKHSLEGNFFDVQNLLVRTLAELNIKCDYQEGNIHYFQYNYKTRKMTIRCALTQTKLVIKVSGAKAAKSKFNSLKHLRLCEAILTQGTDTASAKFLR